MPVVNNPAEIRRLLWLVAVPLFQYLLGSFYELVLHLLAAQHVVRCDACLACVDELAPEDTFNGHHHVD